SAVAVLMGTTLANAAEPIALRDMGSFHVGGRVVEISGKPVKEVTFTPGGVPAKGEQKRNSHLYARAAVCAVFSPRQREGRVSAADVARWRADRRHLRDDAGRARGLAELF